jgi:signal transduction histidine kinase/CheY-like chemotaxis protein
VQPCGNEAEGLLRAHVKHAFAQGRANMKWVYRTQSGERIPCDATFLRTDWIGQSILMCFAQDMRVFEHLETAIEKAQAANAAKGNFLANMTHEIRTPLGTIIGMANLGRASIDGSQKDYALKKIELASNHLLSVVNDVLDISKIEAEKLELHNKPFVFNDMLNEVVSLLAFSMEEKKQVFTLEADPDIPAFIEGDSLRIKQVLINLLSNAVKFTPPGGTITLRARTNENKDTLFIEVADSGIGISPEIQARLFTPYEQGGASVSHEFGGTGLGLMICKRFTELMGGEIKVQSELGKGTTFYIQLPLKNAEAGQETKAAELNANFTGHRILLAEDVQINCEIFAAVLNPTGIEIDTAANGIIAVERFSADPDRYSMIFMDIKMPEMDGLTATRKIRKVEHPRGRTIPIIAMTANAFDEDIEECLQAGMDGHITKPMDYEHVLEAIRRYCID